MAQGDGKAPCRVKDCGRVAVTKARRLCDTHARLERAGKPLHRIKDVSSGGRWGEWYVNPAGYVMRSGRFNGRHRNQLQHRVVMAGTLGRDLYSHESVHHINGDRSDNRVENLELWSSFQPRGQRVEDKIAWAEELLRQYGRL